MPILVKPYLECNLHCSYCYETEYRKHNEPKMDYDLDAVLKAMGEVHHGDREIGLHGGEPLCMPKPDVEKILAKCVELNGKSLIQTNGTLIDDEWIEIFKRNKTHVGISCDGPGELSAFRMDAPTADRLVKTIAKVKKSGLGVSVISIISKSNAGTKEKFSAYKDWLLQLKELGIGGRLNPCGCGQDPKFELNLDGLTEVYKDLTRFCMEHGLTWSPMSDLAVKVGGGGAVCVFQGCDIFHTDSATVILGDGAITNCMRVNQGDIALRHPARYSTRDDLLQTIPQEYYGCKDCEYWNYCRGGCPSTAIDSDWRNRTYLCPVWKGIIEVVLNARKLILHKISSSSGKKSGQGGHKDVHRDNPHTDRVDGHKDIHKDVPHTDTDHRDIGGKK